MDVTYAKPSLFDYIGNTANSQNDLQAIARVFSSRCHAYEQRLPKLHAVTVDELLSTTISNRLFPHGYGLSMMSVQPSYVVGVGREKFNGVDFQIESSRRKTIYKLAYKFGRIGQILIAGKSGRQKYHEKYGALFSDRFRDSNIRLRS